MVSSVKGLMLAGAEVKVDIAVYSVKWYWVSDSVENVENTENVCRVS